MRSNCRFGAFPRHTTQLSGAEGEDEAVYERASGSMLLTAVLGAFLRCAFILSLIEIRVEILFIIQKMTQITPMPVISKSPHSTSIANIMLNNSVMLSLPCARSAQGDPRPGREQQRRDPEASDGFTGESPI
jgi:hypothetical protein